MGNEPGSRTCADIGRCCVPVAHAWHRLKRSAAASEKKGEHLCTTKSQQT
ncbi:hypothetical protein BRYFOR_08451 [Marvinbryantia formatexigens DSM 14469]|uniref:Uncharacterized protein n=1 Tax=Marvinbryantia formatexigens DSM 14469 TaxID=478749 RepID=C6LIL1_9FIRM|nr:hypothetical protein BRYFOR_08451 [Marvinbryantia formatexigens DSM 14469]